LTKCWNKFFNHWPLDSIVVGWTARVGKATVTKGRWPIGKRGRTWAAAKMITARRRPRVSKGAGKPKIRADPTSSPCGGGVQETANKTTGRRNV